MTDIIWASTDSTIIKTDAGEEIVVAPKSAVNANTVREKTRIALEANAAYLALDAPDLSQMRVQIEYLTRECSALIRLIINALNTIEGT